MGFFLGREGSRWEGFKYRGRDSIELEWSKILKNPSGCSEREGPQMRKAGCQCWWAGQGLGSCRESRRGVKPSSPGFMTSGIAGGWVPLQGWERVVLFPSNIQGRC